MKCYLCDKEAPYSYFHYIDGEVRDICHDCYLKRRYGGEKINGRKTVF